MRMHSIAGHSIQIKPSFGMAWNANPARCESGPAPRALAGVILAFGLLLLPATAQAQLRGHGGPVRALAISADGNTAISGSFDTSAILTVREKFEDWRVKVVNVPIQFKGK